MTLSPGTRLGPYEVTALIGAGGMGEVYRARDTQLKRDVALKVLPAAVATDLERLARFQREAELLAALNHPHIAQIYGVAEADGVRALVMELVDGPTLAERIAQGAIPVAEALPIVRQLAEALDEAHERGIVHRDLKPANIKLTPAGAVKVLDFGLAKALGADAAGEAAALSTMTSPAQTQAGIILGTAAYMSPEQARGRPVDKRADIWAFGVVLYEMLTGARTFPGETITDVLGAIVHKEPDWTLLPKDVPARVRAMMEQCLQKDPRARLRDIGDAQREFDAGDVVAGSPGPPVRSRARTAVVLTISAATVAALSFLAGRSPTAPKPPENTPRVSETRFTIVPPNDVRFVDARPSISADGRRLAFIATDDGGQQRVYLRDMQSEHVAPVPGSEGAAMLRLAPDGTWLVFVQNTRLMRVSTDGRANPVPVEGAPILPPRLGTRSVDVGDDGSIWLVADLADGLLRIDPAGRLEVVRQVEWNAGELAILHPTVLPGSRVVLFGMLRPAGWTLMGRSLDTGREVPVLQGVSLAEFGPPDLLIYSLGGGLHRARFNPATLQADPQGVVDSPLPHQTIALDRAVYFALSRSGVLVHLAGAIPPMAEQLVIIDRATKMESVLREPGIRPRFIPGPGDRVVAEDSAQSWIYDLQNGGIRTRLTSGEGLHYVPVPAPDGTRVALSVYDTWAAQLAWFSIGTAEPMQRFTPQRHRRRYASSFTSDGRVAVAELGAETLTDIVIIDPDGAEQEWLKTRFDERYPRFSPDGQWLAYTSDESGRDEVYVRDVQARLRAVLVSRDGGAAPVWDPSGAELFFVRGDAIFAASVVAGDAMSAGQPRLILQVPGMPAPDTVSWPYDVSPDGRRFIVSKVAPEPERTMRVVLGLRPPA